MGWFKEGIIPMCKLAHNITWIRSLNMLNHLLFRCITSITAVDWIKGYSISIANTLKILQSCTKALMCWRNVKNLPRNPLFLLVSSIQLWLLVWWDCRQSRMLGRWLLNSPSSWLYGGQWNMRHGLQLADWMVLIQVVGSFICNEFGVTSGFMTDGNFCYFSEATDSPLHSPNGRQNCLPLGLCKETVKESILTTSVQLLTGVVNG